MKITMKQTADKATGNIPEGYNMNADEWGQLAIDAANGGFNEIFEAIRTAFHYGFVKGHRATLAGKVKKKL